MRSKVAIKEIDESGNDCSIEGIKFSSHNSRKEECPLGLEHTIFYLQKEIVDLHTTQKEGFKSVLDSVSELKDVILNPEKGIYTRVKSLESKGAAVSKLVWIIAGGVVSAATIGLLKLLF
jgi:hypothetical protein